jgi:hypothetical protein
MPKITDTDLAWAAGIIDGEGCISIFKCSPKSKPGSQRSYTLYVRVGNSSFPMTKKLQRLFGGGIGFRPAGRWKSKLPEYKWNVSTHKAVSCLKLILPYLVAKKDQAEVGIEFSKTTKSPGRRGYTDEETRVRHAMYESISALKRVPHMVGD